MSYKLHLNIEQIAIERLYYCPWETLGPVPKNLFHLKLLQINTSDVAVASKHLLDIVTSVESLLTWVCLLHVTHFHVVSASSKNSTSERPITLQFILVNIHHNSITINTSFSKSDTSSSIQTYQYQSLLNFHLKSFSLMFFDYVFYL